MRIFFKKHKIYDVNEFLKLVEREADKLGIDYLSVSTEITRYSKNEYNIEFTCYLSEYDHYNGETIYESLKKLKNAIKPLTKPPKIKIKI